MAKALPTAAAPVSDEEVQRHPHFTTYIHYQDEPDFQARILYDRDDPDDVPTLILESDFHASLFLNFTEDQLRAVRSAIDATLESQKEN